MSETVEESRQKALGLSFLHKQDQSKIGQAVSVNTMLITPETAEKWLANMGPQRKLSARHVQGLLSDWKNGRWCFTGEPIMLDDKGAVFNGQHRLKMVTLCGEPMTFLVVRFKDRAMAQAATLCIDGVRKRSASDYLTKLGRPNGRLVSSIASWVHKYLNGTLRSQTASNGERQLTVTEIAGIIAKFQDIEEAAHFVAGNSHKLCSISSPSIAGFMRWKTHRTHPGESDGFFERLITGTIPERQSGIALLRDRMQREKASQSSRVLNKYVELALTAKAWNAFLAHKPVTRLQFNALIDSFPEIQ